MLERDSQQTVMKRDKDKAKTRQVSRQSQYPDMSKNSSGDEITNVNVFMTTS